MLCRPVFKRNLLAFFLGDISVFEFCPNVTDVILGGTKVTGKFHRTFFWIPVFKLMFLDRSLGDVAVFRFCPQITSLDLYYTLVSGKHDPGDFFWIPVFWQFFLRTVLGFSSGNIQVFESCPNLAVLKLGGFWGCEIKGAFFELSLKDQSLCLIPGTRFTGDISVFEKHQSLQELNLNNCRGIIGTFQERASENQFFDSFPKSAPWIFFR